MTRTLGLLVAALVALGTVGLGAHAASAAGKQVPFGGSYAGTAAADFAAGTVALSGRGVATNLGASTNDGHVQITGPAPAGSCAGGLAAVNTETLTSLANGDSIMLTVYDDVSCPTDSSGLRFHGTGHYLVTGERADSAARPDRGPSTGTATSPRASLPSS